MGHSYCHREKYFSGIIFGFLITMVRIYKVRDSDLKQRTGYKARYFTDITFREPVATCGMILVSLEPGSISAPHGHEHLEEVFMALTIIRVHVDDVTYDLDEGDVIVVDPGEMHSFEVIDQNEGRLLALKFPNIPDDKVTPSSSN